MAWRAPRSLTTFCRDILPLLQEYAQGERLLQTVGQVVATDRWKVDYAKQVRGMSFEKGGAGGSEPCIKCI